MKAYKKKLLNPQSSFHVKRGDQVYILSGKDKGKLGIIRLMDRDRSRAIVDGINVVNGKERLIHISNLKLASKDL
jgi:ribosomal protein L24